MRHCLIILAVASLALGCGRKVPVDLAPTPKAPTSAPIPAPDAFVISENEFAVIRAFLAKHYPTSIGFSPTGTGMLGYPKGSKVSDFLNGGTRFPSIKYKGLDVLELTVESNPPLELRAEDVAKVREWITKYREWKKTAESQRLPEGVPKSLGKLGYTEFTFVTPNVLQVGQVKLEEKGVNVLWTRLTTDLPMLRAFAMDRIKTASQMIAEEDARRASVGVQAKRDRAAVDAALK